MSRLRKWRNLDKALDVCLYVCNEQNQTGTLQPTSMFMDDACIPLKLLASSKNRHHK